MKLKSRRNNKLPIIIAIVVAVVLLLAIIGAALIFSDQEEKHNPQDIESISLRSTPSKIVYYVGEEFDPTGISVRVGTYDLAHSYVVDQGSLTFNGFNSSAPVDEQVITVTYAGFTTTFTVKISEKPSATPVPVGIEVYGFQETYNRDTWKFADSVVRGTSLKVVFSDDSMSESILINPEWMYGWSKNAPAGNVTLTIKYNYNGTILEKVITVTITE